MTEFPNQTAEYPSDGHEKRHLARALEMLASEKMDAKLQQHGIYRTQGAMDVKIGGRMQRIWLVAAAVVLLVGAIFFITQTDNLNAVQLADNQLSTITSDYNPTLRSTNAASHLDVAKAAFARADWKVAEQELDAAITATPATEFADLEQIFFYKGLTYLELENYSSAIEWFSKTLATDAGNFKRDAQWLRGLAYLKIGDINDARKDLEKTAAEANWIKAKTARQILEKLDTTK